MEDIMATFTLTHNEILTELSDRAIRSSVESLKADDRLTIAMREALRNGVSIDDLSEATGVRPLEIRRRVNGSLTVLDDGLLLAS
jgi:hypothetical protein